VNEIVWTIAGSDSGGIAGIQADLHTFQNFGVHGCSVITAITAQNSSEVENIFFLNSEQITAQISAIELDLPPKVIKIGMLGDEAIIEAVIQFLKKYIGKVVLDPILQATSGRVLFSKEPENYITSLKKLFPYVELLTPNLREAELILNRAIETHLEMQEAAHEILKLGPKSVLLKGGHFVGDQLSQDFWTNGKESFWLANQRTTHQNYRGTGCTLSSAISALLALSYDIKEALVISKMYITQGVRYAQRHGRALIASKQYYNQLWSEMMMDIPLLSDQPVIGARQIFPDCGDTPLGLYPIVDSIEWLEKLLPTGVRTLQLRIKNKQGEELENEIRKSIELAKKFETRLFINDYWELAIRFGAYGVHLGQEDLSNASVQKIYEAGLRLGISTGSYYEVAKAHAYNPSYIACGPIFATSSKQTKSKTQGLQQLRRWRKILNYPIVAIGGIDANNFADVLSTNVDGVAMISFIKEHKNPIMVTQRLLNQIKEYQNDRYI
jgi:hydroxymethylpyrimidine kinase / phosphomethylpyrimidine kinase / thiamine-phosphate diphosphorylase